MERSLERLVRRRASGRCEYCRLPEQYSSTPFQIDHIIAEQHAGLTVSANLALACYACNHHKGPNLGGIDPRTGAKTWLFHPRRHKWSRHFVWDGAVLKGRTPVGRTTIAVLAINAPHRIAQRAALLAEGVLPAQEPERGSK